MLDAIRPRRQALRRNRQADTVLYLVENHVVLQRVCADDVVIFRILVSPHDSGGLIDSPRDGFERNADLSIAQAGFVPNCERESAGSLVLRQLCESIRW